MNKLSLVEAVAKQLKVTPRAAANAVEAVLDTIARELADGGTVTVTGFGTFRTAAWGPRTARDLSTGSVISVPARTVPKFVPGQNLKDLVNGAKAVPVDGSAIAKAPKGSLTGGAR